MPDAGHAFDKDWLDCCKVCGEGLENQTPGLHDVTPYRANRRDTFAIAVANWWLRHVLTLGCLIRLDSAYRRGMSCPGHPEPDNGGGATP